MGRASITDQGAAAADDPVRRRRDRIRRLTAMASRTGYLLLAVAVAVFFIAVATDFTGTMAAIVIASLVAASVLLAPAIVLGYAIKAADRADREQSW